MSRDSFPFPGSNPEADKVVADVCGYFGMPGVLRAMVRECEAIASKWEDRDMVAECYRRAAILRKAIEEMGSGE